jgi:hypothetical protein
MLSAADLADMRATVADLLVETATLSRGTPASDGAGGQTVTWATAATVAARLGPVGGSPEEREVAHRVTSPSLRTVTLPAGTDVRLGDRLVISTVTYEVVAVLAPRSWELSRRVVCARAE